MRALMICCLLLFLPIVKESVASSNWLNDEIDLIHQEIDFLRGENRNQNIQIARLQEKVGLEEEEELIPTKLSTDLPENKKYALKESSQQLPSADFHPHRRQKRPAQLTPLELLFHRTGNATTGTDQLQLREFYGPPTSCSDLSQIGYTLNGFYLIKSAAANSLTDSLGFTQLETVFCAFKQPGGPLNSPATEKQIGFLKLDAKASSTSVVAQSPHIKKGNEVKNELSQSETNIESSSSNKLLFHLQIKPNSIVQNSGESVEFDNIILNVNKSYDPKSLAFYAPVNGNYKFVFEAKVLEKKNVTFRYSGRLPPDYSTGWTLTVAAPSDLKNNIVKMVRTVKLGKSTRIQVKSVDTTDGKYTLSASYPTNFKGYLLP